MNKKLRITDVNASDQHALLITWNNGRVVSVNIAEAIHAFRVLEPLRDPAVFHQAEVGQWGFDVVWPNDIELSAATLYRLGMEQAGQAMPKSAFKAWMHRHGLSLTGAAEALHLTRRTITAYSSGPNPIPYHIALACKGWEVMQGAGQMSESRGRYGAEPTAQQCENPAKAVKSSKRKPPAK